MKHSIILHNTSQSKVRFRELGRALTSAVKAYRVQVRGLAEKARVGKCISFCPQLATSYSRLTVWFWFCFFFSLGHSFKRKKSLSIFGRILIFSLSLLACKGCFIFRSLTMAHRLYTFVQLMWCGQLYLLSRQLCSNYLGNGVLNGGFLLCEEQWVAFWF